MGEAYLKQQGNKSPERISLHLVLRGAACSRDLWASASAEGQALAERVLTGSNGSRPACCGAPFRGLLFLIDRNLNLVLLTEDREIHQVRESSLSLEPHRNAGAGPASVQFGRGEMFHRSRNPSQGRVELHNS